jgi:hypothetical protein
MIIIIIIGLNSICTQTMVKDHPASLGVTCGQHVKFPTCWLSRPGWPLQTSSYPNFSRCWVDTSLLSWDRTWYCCVQSSGSAFVLFLSSPGHIEWGLRCIALNLYYRIQHCFDPRWGRNFWPVYMLVSTQHLEEFG